MLWTLWDILIPVALAFLAGLFFGWLLWRWRRQRVNADRLVQVQKQTDHLKMESDRLRHRNTELMERLNSSGSRDSGNLKAELQTARKRIDVLSAELNSARKPARPLAQRGRDDRDTTTSVRELETRLQQANRKINELQANATSSVQSPVKQDDGARARVAQLEAEVRQLNTQVSGVSDLREAITTRDKMIETLQYSLSQYGTDRDSTVLQAEVIQRENKIVALENLLENSQQRFSGGQ